MTMVGLLTGPVDAAEEGDGPDPRIQVAILLDTSNSMDGLINQARTQLWTIVNQFVGAKLAGKRPTLEVALYEYGNDGLPAQTGHLRKVVELTTDLDKVSEALFALKTNGGHEFCGQVIDVAVGQLQWSPSNRDLKCIFVAGNEPFTQGGVDYKKACQDAAAKGITVSTIFCGDHEEGIRTNWQHGAQLADGSYTSVNQDRAVAAVSTPQDPELAKLSAELSQTYLAYGDQKKRLLFSQRQAGQDANAARSAAGAAAARAAFKASSLYRNTAWDLIDAVEGGKVKLETLDEKQLPEILRGVSVQKRKAYVAKMSQRRKQIQAKIQKLTSARKVYLADLRKKQAAAIAAGAPAEASAGEAIIQAVREQAADMDFELEP
jgi:hypothetical protein